MSTDCPRTFPGGPVQRYSILLRTINLSTVPGDLPTQEVHGVARAAHNDTYIADGETYWNTLDEFLDSLRDGSTNDGQK
jgi:hypothetical protein